MSFLIGMYIGTSEKVTVVLKLPEVVKLVVDKYLPPLLIWFAVGLSGPQSIQCLPCDVWVFSVASFSWVWSTDLDAVLSTVLSGIVLGMSAVVVCTRESFHLIWVVSFLIVWRVDNPPNSDCHLPLCFECNYVSDTCWGNSEHKAQLVDRRQS